MEDGTRDLAKGPSYKAPSLKGPSMAKPSSLGKSLGPGFDAPSVGSASNTLGAPKVRNLGSKILGALKLRRRAMGAPMRGRRL